jgi:hypothetical protein
VDPSDYFQHVDSLLAIAFQIAIGGNKPRPLERRYLCRGAVGRPIKLCSCKGTALNVRARRGPRERGALREEEKEEGWNSACPALALLLVLTPTIDRGKRVGHQYANEAIADFEAHHDHVPKEWSNIKLHRNIGHVQYAEAITVDEGGT